MSDDPPVDFQQIAQGPAGATNADYPYSIKATDLMRNFVFATMEVDDLLEEATTGLQGHPKRRLKIRGASQQNSILYWDGSEYIPLAAPALSGTYVLGSVNGVLSWIETEEC